jgi:hypothetical protein
MNFPRQKKPFDTNFIYFDGLNQCQRHVFFLSSKSSDLSHSFFNQGLKIIIINFYIKIEFEKY